MLYNGSYSFPTMDMFDKSAPINEEIEDAKARETAGKLQTVLDNFGIDARVCKFKEYAQFNRFLIEVSPKVKVSKIKGLSDNFALAVGASVDINIIGEYLAIDVSIANPKMIRFGDFRGDYSNTSMLAFPLGNHTVCDLEKMPHLLIAGTTGSGKSVCINTIITGILANNHPNNVRFVMVDPKQVELTPYNDLPQLIYPVITDSSKVPGVLDNAINEMENRYTEFARVGVRDINEYAKKTGRNYQRIVIVIDELADLMMTALRREVEPRIVRLAQKARAAGIHLVIATQEPTVNVITGLIKANMPSRIAFKTATSKESVVILGHGGAEKLLGHGDMLYQAANASTCERLQGVYISDDEVHRVVNHIISQTGKRV